MPFYSNGRTTGLVCDSGDGYTSISSMFEGFFKTNAI
jgi:actin-related protein